MSARPQNAPIRKPALTPLLMRDTPARDSTGYIVFSAGQAGAAHVMAHRLLDEARFDVGHRLLGQWLDGRAGSGSEWVHLQFHMALFELASDDWDAAYARFLEEILPAAATTEWALTDGPALLWRLALTASRPADLPWEVLRRTALRRMKRPSEPFVALHNLLALAGAGDTASIEHWIEAQSRMPRSRVSQLLERMAVALQAYATGDYRRAATMLHNVVPQLPRVGGSRAQNELFTELERASYQRMIGASSERLYANAA